VLSQGAYGPKVGVPLLLDLLERFAMRATFFVPGWVAETLPGGDRPRPPHGPRGGRTTATSTSGPTPIVPDEEARPTSSRGSPRSNAVTGVRPVGFRSPAWELTPRTLPLLREHGFAYSSNLMDDLVPYLHPEGLVELPVQWLLDDAPYFMFQTRPPSRPIWPAELVEKAWLEEFHGLYQLGGHFNLTVHPQFIGRPGRLRMLERVLAAVLTATPTCGWPHCATSPRYWQETHG
jgi:peptidoglycan-N-acetylglucosamine deacetylase